MKKRVIIVGGGFAGVQLAKNLSGSKHFEVILVDRNNSHFFPPLLYQVSAAFVEPSISSSVCNIFRTIHK